MTNNYLLPNWMPPTTIRSQDLLDRWPLAKEFSLTEDSEVLVAGAYKGAVCRLLAEMYDCCGYGFEPQRWAYEEAMKEVAEFHSWLILPFGLGTPLYRGGIPMGEWGTDACGVHRVGQREQGHGWFVDAKPLLDALVMGGEGFDLFVCNMEGFEFELLPYLAIKRWIEPIKKIAIQWHHGISGKDDRYPHLQVMLDKTHDLVIDDAPKWQYWVRR